MQNKHIPDFVPAKFPPLKLLIYLGLKWNQFRVNLETQIYYCQLKWKGATAQVVLSNLTTKHCPSKPRRLKSIWQSSKTIPTDYHRPNASLYGSGRNRSMGTYFV